MVDHTDYTSTHLQHTRLRSITERYTAQAVGRAWLARDCDVAQTARDLGIKIRRVQEKLNLLCAQRGVKGYPALAAALARDTPKRAA